MEPHEAAPPQQPASRRLTAVEEALVADLVADGLRIQDRFRPEPLYRQTGKGRYESRTVEEIRRVEDTKSKRDKP